MQITFPELQQRTAAIADLDAALAVLEWDQEVNMASGGAERRAGQIATLAGLRHERTRSELWPLTQALAEPERLANLTATEQANVRQLYRKLARTMRLDQALVEKLAQTTSRAVHAWQLARSSDAFADFAPHLAALVELKRAEAEAYGYEASPYDALLDSYEPGLRAAFVEKLFSEFKPWLIQTVARLAGTPGPSDKLFKAPVAESAQWNLSLALLERLGFDFTRGRQDKSAHPFTTGFGPEDVRITTMLRGDDVRPLLYSTIHEFGHALYEQGLPAQFYGLPQGQAWSLSIHESQSRLWENNVARSRAFWEYFFAQLAPVYGAAWTGPAAGPEDAFRAVNRIGPSLIRVEADELTYHLHILLRFEIEKDLIEGALKVSDAPEAWKAKMQAYLGVAPPDDRRGILQDIHWSHGGFGYFPTYTLGSLYAAQFFAAAAQALPDLETQIARGEFSALRNWLRENIHVHGTLYESDELCRRATGAGLDVAHFKNYFEQKAAVVYAG